jgi:hypothetical protein
MQPQGCDVCDEARGSKIPQPQAVTSATTPGQCRCPRQVGSRAQTRTRKREARWRGGAMIRSWNAFEH